MRVLDTISALVFSAFLIAPVLSVLGFGYDPEAENAVTRDEIELGSLIQADRTYRDDIIDRALQNSPVGMNAIRLRNWVDYSIIGFVETDQVISGEGDWLYYVPSFEGGECVERRRIEWAIDKVEAFSKVAEAAGIQFVFSVSPDKAVAVESRLGTRASLAAGCKISNAREWRHYARTIGSSIVDHLDAFEDPTLTDEIYFRTDTHWNEFGGALAVRQLASRLIEKDVGLPTLGSGERVSIDTDLRTGMLRLPIQEDTESFPEFWETQFPDRVGAGVTDAVILHDSFYKKITKPLMILFPDGALFDLNHPQPDALQSAIANRPKHLVVNSVERRMIPRLVSQNYSWNSPMGKGLVEANRSIAQGCDYSPIDTRELELSNMSAEPSSGRFLTQRDPKLYLRLKDTARRPCIKIQFSTSSSTVSQLFLPTGAEGGVREGLSVKFFDETGPDRSIELVLPEEFSNSKVRFDPDFGESEIQDLIVEIGEIRN
ncbi:MAG: hypothetical protein AAFP81_04955 [Pseudomonadota bacterium]